MADFPDMLVEGAKIGSKLSRTLPAARFWALIGLAVFTIVCLSVSACFVFSKWNPLVQASALQAEADRDKKLDELNRQVQELTSALTRTNVALAEVKSKRQKDVEAYEAQLEDDRQRLGKLEAQALEIPLLRAEIPLLRTKVASLEKAAKRLTVDFVKSVLAAGATPSTPSYANGPNKLKLPPELEKLSPDLAEECSP